jgi:hypothetical protein
MSFSPLHTRLVPALATVLAVVLGAADARADVPANAAPAATEQAPKPKQTRKEARAADHAAKEAAAAAADAAAARASRTAARADATDAAKARLTSAELAEQEAKQLAIAAAGTATHAHDAATAARKAAEDATAAGAADAAAKESAAVALAAEEETANKDSAEAAAALKAAEEALNTARSKAAETAAQEAAWSGTHLDDCVALRIVTGVGGIPRNLREVARSVDELKLLQVVPVFRAGCPTNEQAEVHVRVTRHADDAMAGTDCPAEEAFAGSGIHACRRMQLDPSDALHTRTGPSVNFYEAFREGCDKAGDDDLDPSCHALVPATGLTWRMWGTVEVRSANGVWYSPSVPIEVKYEAVPVWEVSLANHPGAYAVTFVPCRDLVGAGDDGEASTIYEARCSANPSHVVLVDTLTVAPLATHLRWAPFNDATWMGFAADASALALGQTGLATISTTTDDSSVLVTPFAASMGLDFRMPIDGTRVNGTLGGGFMAVQSLGTMAFRPFLTFFVTVPFATATLSK